MKNSLRKIILRGKPRTGGRIYGSRSNPMKEYGPIMKAHWYMWQYKWYRTLTNTRQRREWLDKTGRAILTFFGVMHPDDYIDLGKKGRVVMFNEASVEHAKKTIKHTLQIEEKRRKAWQQYNDKTIDWFEYTRRAA